jgi:hypothetical protein
MREPDTYQAILDEGHDEGRVEWAQRALLHLGRRTFCEPDESARRAVLAITDLDRLDRLSERLLDVLSGRLPDVSTWQELLQTT